MRKTSRNKSIAFTASLVILMILAILSQVFLNNADACGRHHKPPKPRPPPPGITLVKHFVYPDGSGIGPCLEVTLWNHEQLHTAHTDETGTVTFAGIPDGTYALTWSWQGEPYEEYVELRCTKLEWEFTNELPYWTVIKTFYYNTVPPIPISHLKVTMNGYAGETDETGTIVFNNVKAGEYTIAWVWGGAQQSEDIEIDFSTPTPVELTNYLPPKSGGGTI